MNLSTYFIAMFIAAAYIAWPNLGKALGVKGGLVAFVVIIVALVVVIIMSHDEIDEIRTISANALIWVLVISVANGLAIYAYAGKSSDPNISTSTFLVTVFILQMCFAPIADWLVTGVVPNARQFVGLGLAVPAMWLLAKT